MKKIILTLLIAFCSVSYGNWMESCIKLKTLKCQADFADRKEIKNRDKICKNIATKLCEQIKKDKEPKFPKK